MAGRKSALIVATSNYEDARLTRLEAPVHDARALEQVLKDADIGGFDVMVLEDESKQTIEQELEAFFDKRAREDLLLLYFSGHGITTAAPQRAYFFATRTTRTDRLRSTAIPAGYVNELMRVSRARQKVLLVDCCHGGAFKWDMVKAGTSAGVLESFQGENAPGTGMAVITASQATQYALQGESREGSPVQSVFTGVLVEGLKTGEADLNTDGHVSLDELYDYLRERATTESQSPELNVVGGVGQILVARNPHPKIRPAELPGEVQQALRNDTWWLRKGAVDALASYLERQDPGLALAARLALERMVEDPDKRVSSLAASALAEVPESGVTEWRRIRDEQERESREEQERESREEQRESSKVRFLSDEWARSITEAINSDADAVRAMAGVRLTWQSRVTGGPQGDCAYFLQVEDGKATVSMGELDDADIVAVGSYEQEVRGLTAKNVMGSLFTDGGEIKKGTWKVLRNLPLFARLQKIWLDVGRQVEV